VRPLRGGGGGCMVIAVTSSSRSRRQAFVSGFVLFLCLGTAEQLVEALVHAGHDSFLQRAGSVLLGGVGGGLGIALSDWCRRWRAARWRGPATPNRADRP